MNAKNIILGLQHTFVMFGATVLVPLITGLDVGVTLFAAGVGTFIFHVVTKFKVPVFLGSSFAFIPPMLAVAASSSLAEALGGIFVAGVMYVVIAILFRFIKTDIIHKILPPHVTGPMIVLIGLILAPVAINNAMGIVKDGNEIINVIPTNKAWIISLFTLSVAIFVKVFFEKIGMKLISMLPVLIGLTSGYLLSIALGVVDFTAINDANWVGIPKFSTPKFSWNAILITVPIAIVTIVEHFGDILAIGNVVGKDFVKSPGIHRTLIGDGLATAFSSLIGGPANTTYSENTGAVALTKTFNPLIMRIAATFAIFLSFIPKFTSIISTIPMPVIGGISMLLFGMIASIGVKNMIDAKIDFTNSKIIIISSVMLVIGLGGAVFEFGNFKIEGFGLAAIIGIILNLIINFKSFK